jgi:hypothetical protein
LQALGLLASFVLQQSKATGKTMERLQAKDEKFYGLLKLWLYK